LESVVLQTPIDFNNSNAMTDGKADRADYLALRDSIVRIVDRHFEPFDVNVVVSAASNLNDVNNALSANGRDVRKQCDAYVFITSAAYQARPGGPFELTVGRRTDLLGAAPGFDFNRHQNKRDDTVLVFADAFYGETANNVQVPYDIAMAQVASHEAGHAFGMKHTVETGDRAMMLHSDIMRAGNSDNLDLANSRPTTTWVWISSPARALTTGSRSAASTPRTPASPSKRSQFRLA
jgi:hypothetical protein